MKWILFLMAPLLIAATLTPINPGYRANDGTGDPLRTAVIKANTNFVAINNELSNITASASQNTSITNASTNSFTTDSRSLFSKALINRNIVFWDDFDCPDTNYTGILNRVTPSGHTYRIAGIALTPEGTNGMWIRGGALVQTNIATGPFYLSWSNSMSTTVTRPINWWGMVVEVTDGGGTGFTGAAMLRSGDHQLSGEFLHGPALGYGEIYVQRSLSSDYPITRTLGGVNQTNERIAVECTVVSNTVIMSYAGQTFFGVHTNLASFGFGPVLIWELNGSATNSYNMKIHSIYAGYADPAIVAMADESKGTKLGSNGVSFLNITRPSLTTNTYISTVEDSVVAMPNASASVGGRTNKLPTVGTFWGDTITVYDEGHTAAGTNVYIMTIDGTTINRGPIITNITANGGSMSFLSTPFGWTITSKFP